MRPVSYRATRPTEGINMTAPLNAPAAAQSSLHRNTEDVILLAGRLALGAIFVKSGIQKLLTLSAFAASLAGRGIPYSSTWAVIGATIECVGGILIVTGFKTRPASILM